MAGSQFQLNLNFFYFTILNKVTGISKGDAA